MTDISTMTLNQMLEAGIPIEQITAAIKSMQATKEKENAATAKAKQDQILLARKQYEAAYAKWYKAVTGEDMSEFDIAKYEDIVILPMERLYAKASRSTRREAAAAKPTREKATAKPTREKAAAKPTRGNRYAGGSATEDALIAAILNSME